MITIKDVFEVSKSICDVCDVKSETTCKVCIERVRLESLEKQIAKKPLDKKHLTDFLSVGFCPCCGEGTNEEMKFCSECGQKLNWTEE